MSQRDVTQPPRVLVLSLLVACSTGCGGSGWSDKQFGLTAKDGGSSDDAGQSSSVPQADAGQSMMAATGMSASQPTCIPAMSTDQLRPRDTVMVSAGSQGAAAPMASGVFTRDLFNLFKSNCGACHVEQSLGGLHVTFDNFPMVITEEALKRISSDDPAYFMPPPGGGGMPFSKRADGDPIKELKGLLEQWLAAGKPADVFYPMTASSGANAMSAASFQLTPELGMAMTNLGNCIPSKAMYQSQATKAQQLDAMWEKATALPERLDQTDLYSLDSKTLAADGVVAFAPAYTLWADDAKKIRMIRVPRGTSVVFDKDKQTFTLPANTRVYKTFLKHVVDLDGNPSYRKMETRLIVSRPDKVNADGSRTPTALFGTYAWNDQETEAVLVQDPLRNGKPFRDRLITYVTDEQKADAVISTGPVDLDKALEAAGLTRTYAIPGSDRCMQCHMGSANASFVLGFLPLQINRRPMGQGGVIEPAARDELNQLQRLIDYGVISGMSSPDDVTKLEDSQGDRKPRNDYELAAQGYMLGNCAHCHNPFGFPSVTAPELRDVLNFLPSTTVGGVFQFPLDKVSPRVFRGDKQDQPIPYITPSLYDLGDTTSAPKKVVAKKDASGALTSSGPLLAPWRSLIYRNTDSPFSYVDDSAIFPHMPRNTPGYDCRVRQLFGTWMTSIPASLKANADAAGTDQEIDVSSADPVPYTEVKPGDKLYEAATRQAYYRVMSFQQSPRYTECQPAPDIIDPALRDNPDLGAPRPLYETDKYVYNNFPVPARPHWFVTDLTDAPGDWYPRRADWHDIIVDEQPAALRPGELQLVNQLHTLHVSNHQTLHDLALTDVPFGLWQEKPQCKFPDSVATVAKVAVDQRPQWMKGVAGAPPPPDGAHVYSISPGAQLFASICRNCHGPLADAKSRLADTIADLTGGGTRVANLHDGVFGPTAMPGMNRARVFGPAATGDLTADDWGVRYLTWMTLGGTQRVIPTAVLSLVGNTYVIGEKRSGGKRPLQSGSANMMQLGQYLCGEILPAYERSFDIAHGSLITPATSASADDSSPLIYKNGDAEMWHRLCAFENGLPVRVLTATGYDPKQGPLVRVRIETPSDATVPVYDLFDRNAYGNNPIGDQTGAVKPSLTADNIEPWCLRTPDPSTRSSIEQAWTMQHGAGSLPPYCPSDFLAEQNRLNDEAVLEWTRRGAMNASMSVFLYLDALAKGDKARLPDYNQCEQLTTP